jgi:formate hydrogenlyase transcriptional activator
MLEARAPVRFQPPTSTSSPKSPGKPLLRLKMPRHIKRSHSFRDQLAEEKVYLQDEIRTERNFGEIVGDSLSFKHVLEQVETVVPTDASVLILGETGTGKELIARALHDLSGRRDRTFVKLNCAAIPTGLLESELFGHEKGAFTGAIMRKAGASSWPARGRCFWTRSAISHWRCSPSCCGPCRNTSSSG